MAADTPSRTGQSRILLVEDETDVRELIVLHLERDGYAVDEHAEGLGALPAIERKEHDLYIFDWMLPGTSGLELVRRFRKAGGTAPVLMVTARVEAPDIVAGLEGGADDYVTKPFEVPVLMARVRALLRRSATPALALPAGTAASRPRELIELEGLRIDVAAHEAHCQGKLVPLTASEFRLLHALAENRGRVLTRDKLIDLVRGEDVSIVSRAIDTHVFGLRKKLGSCGELIETIRGVGYRVRL